MHIYISWKESAPPPPPKVCNSCWNLFCCASFLFSPPPPNCPTLLNVVLSICKCTQTDRQAGRQADRLIGIMCTHNVDRQTLWHTVTYWHFVELHVLVSACSPQSNPLSPQEQASNSNSLHTSRTFERVISCPPSSLPPSRGGGLSSPGISSWPTLTGNSQVMDRSQQQTVRELFTGVWVYIPWTNKHLTRGGSQGQREGTRLTFLFWRDLQVNASSAWCPCGAEGQLQVLD